MSSTQEVLHFKCFQSIETVFIQDFLIRTFWLSQNIWVKVKFWVKVMSKVTVVAKVCVCVWLHLASPDVSVDSAAGATTGLIR